MALRSFARCACAMGTAALLAACATTRPVPVPTPAAAEPAAVPAPGSAPPPPAPAPAVPAAVAPDLWQSLRERFAFAQCSVDSRPDPRRARAIATQLGQILPRLVLVEEAFATSAVPGEFVLLPLVESGFRAVPARGGGPAGPWQFMPRTARAYGLAIGPEYDARLDFHASTLAAERLLTDLGRAFDGDWSLANMAFNAGEFRVRRAVRAAGGSTPPHGRLRLSPITHQHLARLVAAACVVLEPQYYGITLPELAPDARLVLVPNPTSLARELALALSGMAARDFDPLNAGPRRARIPAGVHLLLPAPAAQHLQEGLAAVPPQARGDWHLRRDGKAVDYAAIARGAAPGIDAEWLRQLNAARAPTDGVLLPGRAPVAAAPARHGVAANGHYVVRHGDSPWTIARRFRVPLDDWMSWNDLVPGTVLRPGQVVRIAAP